MYTYSIETVVKTIVNRIIFYFHVSTVCDCVVQPGVPGRPGGGGPQAGPVRPQPGLQSNAQPLPHQPGRPSVL